MKNSSKSVPLSPTEIIEAIIAESNLHGFPADHCFHNYLATHKNNYSELLKDFIFEYTEKQAFCEILNKSLTDLEMRLLLEKEQDFMSSSYWIEPKLRSHYTSYLKDKLTVKQKSQIKEISDQFNLFSRKWNKSVK